MRVALGTPLLLVLASCAAPEQAPPTLEELEAIEYHGTLSGVVQVAAGDPVLGDLDGRRGDEIVVVLTEPGEDSAVLVYLAVLSDRRNVATLLLGDRVAIQSLTIEADRLVGELVVAAPDDSPCCPTLRQRVRWRLRDGELQELGREELGRIVR